ncbi:cerevisin [Candida albicans P37005]|nr:cerevisin [Candida albicans P37005]KGU35274.1 cerevisin [Candida albicans P57055]
MKVTNVISFATVASTAVSLVIPDITSFFSSFNQILIPHHQQALLINQDAHLPSDDNQPDTKTGILSNPLNKIIPNHYIVVLKDDLSQAQFLQHQNWVQNEHVSISSCKLNVNKKPLEFFQIDNFVRGYTGFFTDDLINKILELPEVAFVERDSIFHTVEFDIQKDATWGISRVSHRENIDDGKYLFDNDGGKGVTAYVIDTGIKVGHPDFEDRAQWGASIAFPNIKQDYNGHGTHCAGTIGSKTYGIAKNVNLVAVGVMNMLGAGSTSDIIKGLEFVVKSHQDDVRAKKKGFKGSTVNMSIGGGISDALDLAVNAGTKAGLHISVAAGNDNADACQYSPARATGPITIGASNIRDEKASFSNWGSCVDLFAPGEDIESTFIWSDTTVMSGTSMASPHIAGLLSYYLSLQPDVTSEFYTQAIEPADLKNKLIKYGTKGVLTGLDSVSPNILAFNGAGGNLTDFWSL